MHLILLTFKLKYRTPNLNSPTLNVSQQCVFFGKHPSVCICRETHIPEKSAKRCGVLFLTSGDPELAKHCFSSALGFSLRSNNVARHPGSERTDRSAARKSPPQREVRAAVPALFAHRAHSHEKKTKKKTPASSGATIILSVGKRFHHVCAG